jgi:hypothetical protein
LKKKREIKITTAATMDIAIESETEMVNLLCDGGIIFPLTEELTEIESKIIDLLELQNFISDSESTLVSLENFNLILNDEELVEEKINLTLSCAANSFFLPKIEESFFPLHEFSEWIKNLRKLAAKDDFKNSIYQPFDICAHGEAELPYSPKAVPYEIIRNLIEFLNHSETTNIFVCSLDTGNGKYRCHLLVRKEHNQNGTRNLFSSLMVEFKECVDEEDEAYQSSENAVLRTGQSTEVNDGLWIILLLRDGENSQEEETAYLTSLNMDSVHELIHRQFTRLAPTYNEEKYELFFVDRSGVDLPLNEASISGLRDESTIIIVTKSNLEEQLLEIPTLPQIQFSVFPSQKLVAMQLLEVAKSKEVYISRASNFARSTFLSLFPNFVQFDSKQLTD